MFVRFSILFVVPGAEVGHLAVWEGRLNNKKIVLRTSPFNFKKLKKKYFHVF